MLPPSPRDLLAPTLRSRAAIVVGTVALLVILAGIAIAAGTAPDYRWSAQARPPAGGVARGLASLSVSDGVYVAGEVSSGTTFGTGADMTTVTAAVGKVTYLAKYRLDGTLAWVSTLALEGSNEPYPTIRLEGGPDGGVYLSTAVQTSVTDGAWTVRGPTNSIGGTAPTRAAVFSLLVRYLPDGTVDWAQPIRASVAGGSATVTSLAAGSEGVYVVATGNALYLNGVFTPAVPVFGTGPDATSGSPSRTIAVAKYGVDGGVAWAISPVVAGSGPLAAAYGSTLFLAGGFSGNATVGDTVLTSAGPSNDGYLARFEGDGSFSWVRQFGGAASEGLNGVAARSYGVFVTGTFGSGTSTFGSTVLTPADSDVYLASWTLAGGFRWVRQAGGAGGDGAASIAATSSGVVISGYFNSATMTFGSVTLTKNAIPGNYLAAYGADGSVEWARGVADASFIVSAGVVSVGPDLVSVAIASTTTGDLTFDTTSGNVTIDPLSGRTILATFEAPTGSPPDDDATDPGDTMRGSTATPPPAPEAPRGLRVAIAMDRRLVGDRIPLVVSWGGDSGATFELQSRIADGPWSGSVRVTGTTAPVIARAGRLLRIRVRALDASGAAGPWTLSEATTPRLIQERAGRYASGWRRAAGGSFSGGASRWTAVAGRTATFRVTGRAIALVTAGSPASGRIALSYDGRPASGRNLRTAATTRGIIAFARSWATSRPHVIRVRALPTANGQRVDVDALIVLD